MSDSFIIQGTVTGRFYKTRGEGNAMAKLTEHQVRFIKQAVDYGCSMSLLARHFKVSYTQIYMIINGRDWRWV